MMRMLLLSSGFAFALTSMSVAMGSVPTAGRGTDDTAVYQKLSEINVPRQRGINFDSEIAQLSKAEARFNEELPTLSKDARLRGPMGRINGQKYRRSK